MKVLYFAWLAERLQLSEEEVALEQLDQPDVAGLMDWLIERFPAQKALLEDEKSVRVAVNQRLATRSHRLQPQDEVALFPPMTGG